MTNRSPGRILTDIVYRAGTVPAVYELVLYEVGHRRSCGLCPAGDGENAGNSRFQVCQIPDDHTLYLCLRGKEIAMTKAQMR